MLILVYLLLSLLLLMFIPNRYNEILRLAGLVNSILLLVILGYYIYIAKYFHNFYEGLYFHFYNINFFFFNRELNYLITFDNFSLLLMFLTSILYFVCVLVIWDIRYRFKLLNILLYLIVIFILLSFMTFDLFIFYIYFEVILIPMFLVIGIWGSRDRKLTAAFRFFLYTMLGSIFFLTVIIYLYFFFGTTDIYKLIYMVEFDKFIQKIFWLFCFFAFAVKIPVFPFHTWLPEAHAEAPTVGSILLAGVLLKLGPYGIIRFSNFLFPYGLLFFKPIIFLLSLLGVYYTAITAIRQLDIKKIIAYSSIGHMALILLGISTNTIEGFMGAITLLLAHGFVSGGLFLLIGCIYERYGTRNILYYNGLVQINPYLAVYFFLFLLGNIAFPGTLNFLSELLILLSLVELNFFVLILVAFSSVFVLSYNLFLFSRLFFYPGTINNVYNPDLSVREQIACIIFIFPVFYFGLFSTYFFNFFYKNVILLYFFSYYTLL